MTEIISQLFSANLSLWGLFISSFLASTLLPGGSEIVMVGVLKLHPELFWPALLLGTIGNTLGGMVSFAMGRMLPPTHKIKYVGKVQQYGAPVLLLAWAPLLGDVLCLGAGWLRLNPRHAALFMAIGKFTRYWLIAIAL
jgi:membrane protein YqaA with SNARE-associated domain